MTVATSSIASVRIVGNTSGAMSRVMIRQCDAPIERATSTKVRSRTSSVWARAVRR